MQFSGPANYESVSAIGAAYVTRPDVSKPSDHGFPDANANRRGAQRFTFANTLANTFANANRRNQERFTFANADAALDQILF